jgi:type I restriction enzyme S subunit
MASEPGPYPLVVTAAFRRSSDSFQFTRPAACIPTISPTGHGNAAIHRIHYQDGRFALANLLVAATPKDEARLNAKYLWRYLSAVKDRKLVPLMQGTANVSLKGGRPSGRDD